MAGADDCMLYLLAIFVPPASVGIKRGCGGQVCLNIVLWLLFWLPAVIHAFYIIAATPDFQRNYPDSGAIYVEQRYVNGQGHGQGMGQAYGQAPPPPPPHGGWQGSQPNIHHQNSYQGYQHQQYQHQPQYGQPQQQYGSYKQ